MYGDGGTPFGGGGTAAGTGTLAATGMGAHTIAQILLAVTLVFVGVLLMRLYRRAVVRSR